MKEYPELLNDAEAARYLGLKNKGTLAVWRVTGRHKLPFVRIGRNVRYRREELEKFLASNTHVSTAELAAA